MHVIASTSRRGAEVFACDLAEPLRRRHIDVELVALTPVADSTALPVQVLGRRRFGLAVLAALRTRMRSVEVVVAHGSSTLPAAVVASIGSEVPIIYRSIGDSRAWTGNWHRRARVRFLLQRTAAVVGLWEDATTALGQRYGLPKERLRTIPNAVDGNRFRPPTAEERAHARARLGVSERHPIVAFVGALTEEKNPGLAVEAVAAIPDAYFVMAGAGPLQSLMEHLVKSRLPGRATLLGPGEEMQPIYWAADILILPSRTEGMPAAPIEAGLCAVPTVAARVGGVPHVVIDAQNGALFEPGDVATAAAKIRQVLGDLEQYSKAAREHARRNFDLEAAADAWAELIQGEAAEPRRARA